MRLHVQLLVAAVVLTVPTFAQAQRAPDTAGVRAAVLDYVEGFYQGDSTRHVRSVSPRVYKYGYYIPRDSTRYVGERMQWPEFHAYDNRVKQQGRFAPASAPREITIFEVLDQTASAKLRASWGVDYLLLARENGRWVITHVLWQTPPRP